MPRHRVTARRETDGAAVYGLGIELDRGRVPEERNQGRAAQGSAGDREAVRSQIAARRIVHLACHGLADNSYGNFFGALALTPGRQGADATDDGISHVDGDLQPAADGYGVGAAERLAETNYGPEQRGEGVWTLSRGFLVAGCRRVVASNWLVDDEAAATLISYFWHAIARAEQGGTGRLRGGAAPGQGASAPRAKMARPVLLGNVCARGAQLTRREHVSVKDRS